LFYIVTLIQRYASFIHAIGSWLLSQCFPPRFPFPFPCLLGIGGGGAFSVLSLSGDDGDADAADDDDDDADAVVGTAAVGFLEYERAPPVGVFWLLLLLLLMLLLLLVVPLSVDGCDDTGVESSVVAVVVVAGCVVVVVVVVVVDDVGAAAAAAADDDDDDDDADDDDADDDDAAGRLDLCSSLFLASALARAVTFVAFAFNFSTRLLMSRICFAHACTVFWYCGSLLKVVTIIRIDCSLHATNSWRSWTMPFSTCCCESVSSCRTDERPCTAGSVAASNAAAISVVAALAVVAVVDVTLMRRTTSG
jgi:hypothetical protein